MTIDMLQNIIKYYAKVTDMALVNLSQNKQFQFRKMLTNHSLMQVTEDNLLQLHDSENARKLINDYKIAMNDMAKIASKDYNKVLNQLKSTNDDTLRQKILNDYAERGIHGFTARNGARWNIETYSNMYTTHVNNQLIRMAVLENSKVDMFQVSTHGTICDLCIPYEGQLLTRQELDDSTLFHPRCLHFIVEVIKSER
jgi:hypothetical protein